MNEREGEGGEEKREGETAVNDTVETRYRSFES